MAAEHVDDDPGRAVPRSAMASHRSPWWPAIAFTPTRWPLLLSFSDRPEVARDRTESFRLVAGATGDGVVRAQFAPALTLLTVITALVLVVACTNFTNLMFARAEARRREFLIRLAVGADRWRLIRQ